MAYKIKLTKRKKAYFMADEKKAIKEYKKAGLNNLARDEIKHYKYLKKLK
jgi:hypothetical protein